MPASHDKNSLVNQRISKNLRVLGLMLLITGLYVGWFDYFGYLTGSNRLDGTFGILLGLFIGSQPAANMLDILLFMTADIRESLLSTNLGRFWLFLNLLNLIAAWVVIFTAVLRFAYRVF